MRSIHVPKDLRDFAAVLENAGWKCYLVGGAVRDYLLGRPVSDFDTATDARPEDVLKCFRSVIPTGIKHGTVTVLFRGHRIETTTFRTDSGYSDARRPDSVEYSSSIEEDLGRRDFTINAMAWEISGEKLLDLHGGQKDLKLKLIRAVGPAMERFSEDGLRPLRALRFASQLEFEIESSTFAAIPGTLDRFRLVSMERIRDEFEKIMLSARPSLGLGLMESSGVLGVVIPELLECRGVGQKGGHRFDVLDHLFMTADASPPVLSSRLAALFHDIGKPASKKTAEDGIPTFYRHDEISAESCGRILKRMRFPKSLTDDVVHLVGNHMFHYESSWTDSAVRRFVARVGEDNLEPLFALRLADTSGTTGIRADPRNLVEFRTRIECLLAKEHALGIRDLAINGGDLSALGIPKGPVMGKILAELLETVLDDPEQNSKERLSLIAGKLKEKYGLDRGV